MSTTATHTPPLAAELDLVVPEAIRIAAIPDVGARREAAARAAEDRRVQLATYRAVYRETYGHALSAAQVEGGDEVLAELLVLTVA